MCLIVQNSIFEVHEPTAFGGLTFFIFDEIGAFSDGSLTLPAQKQNRPISSSRVPFLVKHDLCGDS